MRLAGRFSVLGCCSERRELGTPSFCMMSSWSLFLLVPPLAWADVPSWAVEVEASSFARWLYVEAHFLLELVSVRMPDVK